MTRLLQKALHESNPNPILMKPDDQCLCIVPGGERQSKERVFPPFEGGGLLSVIVRKAFHLVADDKIKDTTITPSDQQAVHFIQLK